MPASYNGPANPILLSRVTSSFSVDSEVYAPGAIVTLNFTMGSYADEGTSATAFCYGAISWSVNGGDFTNDQSVLNFQQNYPPGLVGSYNIRFQLSANYTDQGWTWITPEASYGPSVGVNGSGDEGGWNSIWGFVTTGLPLAISPVLQYIFTGEVGKMTASGGEPPYTWYIEALPPMPGSLIPTSGAVVNYITGGQGSAEFMVQDSGYTEATSRILITSNLKCTPSNTPDNPIVINPGQTQPLVASGGVPPYTWSFGDSGSGGSISSDGLYTAGKTPYKDQVNLNDSDPSSSTQFCFFQVAGLTIAPSTGSVPLIIPGGQQVFTASYGTPPYTWSITQNTTPILGRLS